MSPSEDALVAFERALELHDWVEGLGFSIGFRVEGLGFVVGFRV